MNINGEVTGYKTIATVLGNLRSIDANAGVEGNRQTYDV